MSFKTISRVAAASAVLGVAVLNPSVAQAKDPPTLSGAVTLSVCPAELGGDARLSTDGSGTVGNLGPTSYTMNISGAIANNTYDFRARYSYIPTGSTQRVFSKARDVLVSTDATGTASYAGNISVNGTGVRIYRLDVVDVSSILDKLVYTSDGVAGCD
jgi:hypothetical protein